MAISTINLQPSTWEYGVFLSFRGEDSFKNFTGHLYSALCNASIRTFIDEEELRKGESLAPELTRAIQNSRVSMIVFSKNYASSRWCLDELLQILQCREKGKQLVYPIFYDVEPSEVRNQSGNYGIALAKHEERFGRSDKIQNWRDALTKVANISGWDLQGPMNGYESKLIDEIVQDVLRIVSPRIMPVAKHVVGLESRVDDVLQFNYGTNNNDVRMIGIYGMGGIGKSTLAKALYNKLLGYFERSYFLEISSEILETKKLQEELLSKLLNKRKIEVGSEGEGKMLIKYWLQAKKCLIVLDNLEHRNQFEALCGERDWFGKGSTLILTTRDAHVLKELNKGECYEAKTLVHEESLQLFRLHAFREPTLPKEDYAEVLDRILAYCEGLPLALEVLGSYLSGRSMEEWISAFEKLRKIPHNDVQAKLKISYEGLPDDHTKSLFLDLVCFYGEISEETFNAMGYFSTIEIRNLVDKCLISPWYYSMHSLIREMGREIIRSESPNKPGERSRLWCPSDIHDVLIQQKGTEKIEMIVLNSPMKNMEYKYNTKAFKDMKNLRFLQIDGIHLEGNFKHLPRNVLRFLRWNQCPLKYIPSAYSFERLVKLEMWESNIKEFGVPLKYFQCLEALDLGWCHYLTRTPDFSGAKNLRTLSFWGCSSLEKVHSSIGDLRMLVELDLSCCERLKKIPKKFWHWQLRSVEDPSSSVCYSSKIKELGENSGMLTSLRRLVLSGTNIHFLPYNTSHLLKPAKSISNLRSFFQNNHLKLIQQFPPNIEHISLRNCKNLKMLPQLPQNLLSLCAINCESLETVHLPKMLKIVNLTNCKKLKEIQGWENAQFLRIITLRGVPNIKFSENINQVGFKSFHVEFPY
ncbi:TMV resistance protein N-like isoform X2 [Ipomoea triloba]|uniref:TMV resistance protein N-like isoform X2 n=1 Tax=Ipomoea triloba TaxID=35885 RepID=UPI00125D266D|nr:TMV resistance protein N-like isoform X2 [Ipomoea triloba]